MAHYLVTGGAGFIGSHLCDALIRQGHQVRILDNFSTGRWENIHPKAAVVCGDVANPIIVRHVLRGMDGVFHLAAVASVQKSNEAWYATHRTNISATVGIFEGVAQEAARLKKDAPAPVVYASSAAVYGAAGGYALTEDDPTNPLTAYGVDKLACEHHARIGGIIHGIPSAGFRFFNVYGSRQDPRSPYSGVISIFADRAVCGREITVFGDGRQVRDFIHVSDIVRFLLAGMEHASVEAPVFNACTGRETDLNRLLDTIGGIVGADPKRRTAGARPGDIVYSLGSPRKAAAALGIEARKSLPDGLADLIASLGSARMAA